ncbi:GntR family transcriptional regulator [Streptomyces solicathayae]|uniref:GntR family transcriptional regulator n=1 Tax=Streptomyces solicathayae TaxID=3081768 RepID=A0ABZ0LTE5_9ACTN|nr:GntR family transcriptional regulator [Streptomyces sp. HUAS YS2]WOX22714.1 GntR family transcriptional regulator [Streptomyces sp. HUAS YS2]
MTQQASPRGTFLKIADALRTDIESDLKATELPTLAEVMDRFGVSRGLALRAFRVLRADGVAEPVPGGRWRVIRGDHGAGRRSLTERISDVMLTDDSVAVGKPFLSASKLAERLGVARPTVAKALAELEAAGLLSESRQGKARTVLALPGGEERS